MLKTRILIHAKLPIFIISRKFIHGKIFTFTVLGNLYFAINPSEDEECDWSGYTECSGLITGVGVGGG